MNEILHANIFFIITSIAVGIFTAILCVALFYFIKILKSLRRIVERIEEETEVISEDIHHVREFFTQGGIVGRIIAMFMGSGRRAARGRERTSRSKKNIALHITE